MTTKPNKLIRQLLRSPLRFPVEAALGLVFFCMAACCSESYMSNEKNGSDTLAVRSISGTVFLVAANQPLGIFHLIFLFLPLAAINLKPFLETYGFWFTYVLAGILLIVGNKKLDNRSFAAHSLHVTTQMFFGLLITGIFNLVVVAIFASYILLNWNLFD